MKKLEDYVIIKFIVEKFNMVFKTRVSRIVSSSIIFFSFGVVFASSCIAVIRTIDSRKGVGGLETSAVPVYTADDDYKALSGLLEETKEPEPAKEVAFIDPANSTAATESVSLEPAVLTYPIISPDFTRYV